MVGSARPVTVRLTDGAPAPALGVCVVVTPVVVLGFMPTLLLVTVKVTVQLPPAESEMPVKLTGLVLAPSVLGVVPLQVPPTAPATTLMLVSVSLKEALLRAVLPLPLT